MPRRSRSPPQRKRHPKRIQPAHPSVRPHPARWWTRGSWSPVPGQTENSPACVQSPEGGIIRYRVAARSSPGADRRSGVNCRHPGPGPRAGGGDFISRQPDREPATHSPIRRVSAGLPRRGVVGNTGANSVATLRTDTRDSPLEAQGPWHLPKRSFARANASASYRAVRSPSATNFRRCGTFRASARIRQPGGLGLRPPHIVSASLDRASPNMI